MRILADEKKRREKNKREEKTILGTVQEEKTGNQIGQKNDTI